MNMEYNYSLIEKNFIDYIISIAGPSKEQDDLRQSKSSIIKKVIANGFINEPDIIVHTFSFGSFPFKSYHRDSDMDISVVLVDKKTNKLISAYTVEYLNHILNIIESSIRSYYSQCCIEDYIERIEADVRLIKCKFEGVSFDISINNFVGLFKLIFMHHIEKNYLDSLFYKRTLLLIKSWCYYEGCILGSNVGLLGSYALEILVIYMFNNYSEMFQNELEAFFTFFHLMNKIDWENQILTIYGLFDIATLTNYNLNLENLFKEFKFDQKQKIKHTAIAEFSKQFERFNDIEKVQNFNVNKKILMIGKYSMYIIDPIYNTNNLAKSVNAHNYSRIKELFSYMNIKCGEILKSRINNSYTPSEYFNTLLKLYSNVVIANNPDLFHLSLPEPKIIILPSKTGGNNGNENGKKDEDDLISNFNKTFSLEDNSSSSSGEKKTVNNQNRGMNAINKVNGLLWPSNVEIQEEQTLIDYANCNINNINYITKEILEFVNTNSMNIANNVQQYEFKTVEEVVEIENFEKNVLI